jgi:hypothetical protein
MHKKRISYINFDINETSTIHTLKAANVIVLNDRQKDLNNTFHKMYPFWSK